MTAGSIITFTRFDNIEPLNNYVPKYHRKALFGEIRKHLGAIFHELARQKECQSIEGHLMPDQVHMCIAPAQAGSRFGDWVH